MPRTSGSVEFIDTILELMVDRPIAIRLTICVDTGAGTYERLGHSTRAVVVFGRTYQRIRPSWPHEHVARWRY